MYINDMSIPDISRETHLPRSAVRTWLINQGIKLRSRKEAVVLANTQGKLGSGLKGKIRPPFTQEWCNKISQSRHLYYDRIGRKGFRIKTDGHLEFTCGPNKGRLVHDVIMESIIGRKLLPNELVHHVDEKPGNNDPLNLNLLTFEEHSRLHAIKNCPKIERNKKGQFKRRENNGESMHLGW
jgi:hypothetical protein